MTIDRLIVTDGKLELAYQEKVKLLEGYEAENKRLTAEINRLRAFEERSAEVEDVIAQHKIRADHWQDRAERAEKQLGLAERARSDLDRSLTVSADTLRFRDEQLAALQAECNLALNNVEVSQEQVKKLARDKDILEKKVAKLSYLEEAVKGIKVA